MAQFQAGAWNFPHRPYRLWNQPSLLFNQYQEVKQPEREADISPATSTEVKEVWKYTST
jgi:hypothetical protein